MKWTHSDIGHDREYYKEDGCIYCVQPDPAGKFKWFRCSKDGEPSYEIKPPQITVAKARPRSIEEIVSKHYGSVE